MKEISITSNDAGRRLDRFLRKYLPGASLSEIYKIIRKDVKVDAKRRPESYMLSEGEVVTLYLSDEAFEKLSGRHSGSAPKATAKAKRTFGIVYEDDQLLIANKPYGLLTHGDSREKKDHLANQVKDYLTATGAYDPRSEKVFTPAPVNRLDRNTTGAVMFGKTSASLRELTRIIREDEVRKFYITLACGAITDEMDLGGYLVKDESSNRVKILHGGGSEADALAGVKDIETIVRPLEVLDLGSGLSATLCEIELVTGRSHQIRAHLASTGHPLAGDVKYAGQTSIKGGARQTRLINSYMKERFGLTTQLLHARRLEFPSSVSDSDVLGYLAGKAFEAPLPPRFRDILKGLGSKYNF